MRGHIARRGNSWTCYFDRPRDPVTGKRRKTSKSGFPTKKAAERWLANLVTSLDQGTFVEASKQTLAQFLTEWLPTAETRGLRPSTRANYRYLIKHIVPRLGGVRLQRLTPGQLNAMYAELLATGRCDGKGGLSAKTVREVHSLLHRALADAVRWGLLTRSPADSADPPRKQTRERQAWTAEQLAAFLRHVKGDRLYAAYHLAAMTGMRRGEVLGLRWRDLDLDAGRLTVVQTLIVVGPDYEFGTPKTARGRRSLALDPGTVAVLRDHREAQELERHYLGLDPTGDLVFTTIEGGPLSPRAFTKAFQQRVKRAGLPQIPLHALRHTHATLALQAGIHPKVVSERLGHSSVSITLDVYSHAIPAMEETAAALVATLVLGEEDASVALLEPPGNPDGPSPSSEV
jgi:integrase